MTEPVINTTNAVPDEDDNPESHVGERIADDDTHDPIEAANDQFATDLDNAMGATE